MAHLYPRVEAINSSPILESWKSRYCLKSMTRNVHDQFAKEWMQELLVDFGEVEIEFQVGTEIRKIDVYFKPNPIADPSPKVVGSFGKMLMTPALLEPFRNAVSSDGLEDCLDKLSVVRDAIKRHAKREKCRLRETDRPRLWILSPTVSASLRQVTEAKEKRGWPQGIYFMPSFHRTALVAVHQLPVNLDTLWLRLFGKGTVQAQAAREILALRADHPYRQQTIEHLARLQMTLQARQNESRLFREVAMNLSPVYDEWREKTLAEGREQGISQGISLGREQGISLGREQGQLGLLKQQLVVKFTPVPDRILSQVDRLSSENLTELAIALLSFERVADLAGWLADRVAE
jgi:hypothetical protein